MNPQTQHNSPLANDPALRDSRTARFNLPVRHPPLWRFVRDQLLSPAMRIHRYRGLSARMFEDTMSEIDRGGCQ